MEYICPRCNYNTNRKDYYIKHLNRKHICPPINQDISIEILRNTFDKKNVKFICLSCNKSFEHATSLSRHKKNCSKNVDKSIIANLKIELRNEIIAELNKDKEKSINNNCNITNNNVQHNNTITIQLKSFGFENIKHLESDKDYMTKCLLNKDVIKLLENIHCDVEYPENTNVKIKSTKRELMETFIDGHWMISDQEETLDELINKGYRILNFFRHRNKDHILKECEDGEGEYNEMIDWLEDLYSNTKTRKPLKRKMLILFMNNKTYFLNKEELNKEEPIKNIIIPNNKEKNIIIPNNKEENIIIQDEEDNDDDSVISDRSYEPEEMSPEEAAKYTQSVWNPNKNIR